MHVVLMFASVLVHIRFSGKECLSAPERAMPSNVRPHHAPHLVSISYTLGLCLPERLDNARQLSGPDFACISPDQCSACPSQSSLYPNAYAGTLLMTIVTYPHQIGIGQATLRSAYFCLQSI
jgi:hypothetical protein